MKEIKEMLRAVQFLWFLLFLWDLKLKKICASNLSELVNAPLKCSTFANEIKPHKGLRFRPIETIWTPRSDTSNESSR